MSKLLNDLQQFKTKRDAIHANKDYSTEGKRKQLDALARDEAQFRKTAHNDLTMSWRVMRGKLEKLATAKAEAQDKAAKEWDFNRLLYNAHAIESEVKQAASITDVKRKYDDVLKSGDKHARRAWAENVFSEASKHFRTAPASELNDLKRTAAQDLKSLTITPELESIANQENDLTQQAVELHKETQIIGRYFSAGDWTGQGNEFYKLIDGVRVSESVDTATLATSYSVVI